MLGQCWPTVCDDGSTLKHHWVIITRWLQSLSDVTLVREARLILAHCWSTAGTPGPTLLKHRVIVTWNLCYVSLVRKKRFNAGSMLASCQQRWPNIKPKLGYIRCQHVQKSQPNVVSMLDHLLRCLTNIGLIKYYNTMTQCWQTVCDAGTTLRQYYVSFSCLCMRCQARQANTPAISQCRLGGGTASATLGQHLAGIVRACQPAQAVTHT